MSATVPADPPRRRGSGASALSGIAWTICGVVDRHHGIGWNTSTSALTTPPRRFRAGHARPTQRERCLLPGAATACFASARGPRRARDDGRRFVLLVEDLPPPANNRSCDKSSRTLTPKTSEKAEQFIPNHASRMGLHASLPELRSAIRRAARRAPSLQLASATWYPEGQHAPSADLVNRRTTC